MSPQCLSVLRKAAWRLEKHKGGERYWWVPGRSRGPCSAGSHSQRTRPCWDKALRWSASLGSMEGAHSLWVFLPLFLPCLLAPRPLFGGADSCICFLVFVLRYHPFPFSVYLNFHQPSQIPLQHTVSLFESRGTSLFLINTCISHSREIEGIINSVISFPTGWEGPRYLRAPPWIWILFS